MEIQTSRKEKQEMMKLNYCNKNPEKHDFENFTKPPKIDEEYFRKKYKSSNKIFFLFPSEILIMSSSTLVTSTK